MKVEKQSLSIISWNFFLKKGVFISGKMGENLVKRRHQELVALPQIGAS